MDLLRPPAGYTLDIAILTTYSLDLEALLALPLAVLAHADGGVDELLEDPMLLLEALREAGERVHVFVDQAGIAVPNTSRELYAMLEPSVHPVRARNGGVFHPKLWLARFVRQDTPPLLRVSVLSRNLTFDRSWDIALTSEAEPAAKQRAVVSRDLAQLISELPQLALQPLSESTLERIASLTDEVARTRFPAPEDMDGWVTFNALGLREGKQRPWCPQRDGTRLLAIAPFVNQLALDTLVGMSTRPRTLVSRQEELDKLSAAAIQGWDRVCVLTDTALDEDADPSNSDGTLPATGQRRPSGLHAKLIAVEQGWDVTWYAGSANFTAAAFTGTNVELVACVTGKKGRKTGKTGIGIDRFFESGFDKLCVPYRRTEKQPDDDMVVAATKLLERTRDLIVKAPLRLSCSSCGEDWTLRLDGEFAVPDGVSVSVWPVTLMQDQARALTPLPEWVLPTSRLTAFIAFELRVPAAGVDDLRFALKLPASGFPEGRLAQVLRTLIDSPERFLRFLRALLGGLEGLADWGLDRSNGSERGSWGSWMTSETLLEDLVRTATRDPERLVPIRRLIDELRSTEEGRRIVPDDLFAIWLAVDEAVGKGATSEAS